MKNFVTAFLALAMVAGFGSPVLAHEKCEKKHGCKQSKDCPKKDCNKGGEDDCCKDKSDNKDAKDDKSPDKKD